jgi:hypothetical protein
MNKFCTTCGTTLAPNTKFCGGCGTGVAQPAQPVVQAMTVPHVPSSAPSQYAPAPPPYAPAPPQYPYSPYRAAVPAPPSLHWGIVLALSIVTFGLFAWIWALVQAIWVKRRCTVTTPVIWISLSLPLAFVGGVGGVVFIIGMFSIRKYLLIHFNSVEPINLQLGPWGTFFGQICYLQYHFDRIAGLQRQHPQFFAPYCTPIAFAPTIPYRPTM